MRAGHVFGVSDDGCAGPDARARFYYWDEGSQVPEVACLDQMKADSQTWLDRSQQRPHSGRLRVLRDSDCRRSASW